MDIDTDKIDEAVLALLYLKHCTTGSVPGRATIGMRWIVCIGRG